MSNALRSDQSKEIKAIYDKTHLVPFGEYVPFLDIFGNLLNFIGINITNMQPGYEYKTLKIGKYVVSPTICYEIAFESIVLETASISNLFITLSNDTWFGDSIGPYQHLNIARIRSIEIIDGQLEQQMMVFQQ